MKCDGAWAPRHRWIEDRVGGDPRARVCRYCPATAMIDDQGRTIRTPSVQAPPVQIPA